TETEASWSYPNLSQCATNCAQTTQSEPNGAFSFHQLTREPDATTRFAKPLYWLKPVPGDRIPPSPPHSPTDYNWFRHGRKFGQGGRKDNLVEPIGSESFAMHVPVAGFSCSLTRRICCSRTCVLQPRKLFLANVIIDPLEDWPETELP